MTKKLTTKEQAVLLDLVEDDTLRQQVIDGELMIEPGQTKPVLKNKIGQFVKGSGRPVNANDAAFIGKSTGWKRSNAAKEFFEQLIPNEYSDSKIAVTSIQELTEAAARASTGAPVPVTCPKCEHKFTKSIGVDSKILTWLLARRVGEPTKTAEINIRSEQLVEMLTDQTPVVEGEFRVVSLTPEELQENRQLFEESE